MVQSDPASSDPSSMRRRLDVHAATLISHWTPISRSGWDRDAARQVSEDLLDLVASNDSQPWPTLQSRALDLAAYLSSFVDDRLDPSSDQSQQLEALFAALGSALSVAGDAEQLAEHRADKGEGAAAQTRGTSTGNVARSAPAQAPINEVAQRRERADADIAAAEKLTQNGSIRRHAPLEVCLLGLDEAAAPGLNQALSERDYTAVELADTALLSRYLEQQLPAALIVHARYLKTFSRLLEQLKPEAGSHRPRPVLMVLSPTGDLSHRLLAMRCGAQAVLSMPVDGMRVMARLEALQERASAPSCRVLLIEPDRELAVTCARWLSRDGMTARIATGAEDGLQAIGEFNPEVIVIDIELPGISAIELTALIRQQTDSSQAPIVFLAPQRGAPLRFDAIAAGGDEFLLKPLRPRHLVGSVRSRADRARLLSKPSVRRSQQDPQTRLYPRAHLVERCGQLLGDPRAALIFVSLDRSERLKDKLGLSGLGQIDALMGPRLAHELGENDIACGYQDLSYLLLVKRSGLSQISELAERIRMTVCATPLEVAGQSWSVTASLGASMLVDEPEAEISVDNMVHKVEAVSIAAGHLGGNRLLWYTPHETSLKPPDPEVGMRALFSKPLSGESHQLTFQPIVPLSGKLSGQYELVFRIRAPQKHQRAFRYSEFAPLAAESGQLLKLDLWLLDQALDARSRALQKGRQIRLFLRQSLQTLANPQFHEHLEAALKQRHLSGAGLTFEYDCSALLDQRKKLAEGTARLRRLGIRIGLCEIGRDWAAVHALKQMDVDFVRVVPELVESVWQAHGVRDTLTMLVRRAHELGAAVIAPLVDSAGRARLLAGMGVDYGQGVGLAAESDEPDFDFARNTL